MKKIGLIILAFTNLMLLSAQSGGWRNYEVYQPKIERGYVVEAAL